MNNGSGKQVLLCNVQLSSLEKYFFAFIFLYKEKLYLVKRQENFVIHASFSVEIKHLFENLFVQTRLNVHVCFNWTSPICDIN